VILFKRLAGEFHFGFYPDFLDTKRKVLYVESSCIISLDIDKMATIFPEQFPKLGLEQLRGEAKVFQALKTQLGNEYDVFYNVYWHQKPDDHSRQRDGEIDFIITHPRYGILVVEVKGGVFIQYHAEDDSWRSTDMGLDVNSIHNPYNQARKNKYALIDNLHQHSSFRQFDKGELDSKLNVGYCVAFPDVTRISGHLPDYAKDEITLFEFDINNAAKRIPKIMEYYAQNITIDQELLKKAHVEIKNILAPLLTMDRSMPYWIKEEEKRMIELTEDQFNLLTVIQCLKQASIYGCAGSGKTLLALKKAEKAAALNQKTLLCCFNSILGKNFRRFSEGKENLIADNFHNIMWELLSPFTDDPTRLLKDDEFMQYVIDFDIPKFDCILIDEAQDFSKDQLDILNYLLKKDGTLYYFWDSNQKIIRDDVNIPENVPKLVLNTNLRNTEKIFDEIKLHYHEDLELIHKGPEGRKVKVCESYKAQNAQDLFLKLRKELNDLIVEHQIKPEDITILSFMAKDKSLLKDFTYKEIPVICFEDEPVARSIRVDTVRRFKGMESPVIIVTEMDNEKSMNDPLLWDDMCYVSYSRAKNHLVILPPDNVKL